MIFFQFFCRFQEYKKSLDKLKKAYYFDTTNTSATESGNIDLLSDIMYRDGILKSVAFHTKINHKSTFLFR